MNTEAHFYALIVPVEKERFKSARNRRRRGAKLLDDAREILISGMTFEAFGKLTVTGQFQHLKSQVPDGWRPVDFKEGQA